MSLGVVGRGGWHGLISSKIIIPCLLKHWLGQVAGYSEVAPEYNSPSLFLKKPTILILGVVGWAKKKWIAQLRHGSFLS